MKLKTERGPLALLTVRAASAATIIGYALGYQVPIVALQGAELVTVCLNTIWLLISFAVAAIAVSHQLYGTGLTKPPRTRSPLLKAVFGTVFACELAAFALIGWWFTLGLRVAARVIINSMPHEEPAA